MPLHDKPPSQYDLVLTPLTKSIKRFKTFNTADKKQNSRDSRTRNINHHQWYVNRYLTNSLRLLLDGK